MVDIKRIKRPAIFIPIIVILGIIIILLRGPHVSNALKRVILPELELMTGKKVIANKFYINIFPLFVGAEDLKVFDDNGEKFLYVKRVKAYGGIGGIFSRRIELRRLVLREPVITTTRKQAEEVVENVKHYLARVRPNALKVNVHAVDIQKGSVQISASDIGDAADIRGLNAEMSLGNAPSVRVRADTVTFRRKGWPELTGDVLADLSLKDRVITVYKLNVGSFGSKMTASGEYSDRGGSFAARIDLLADTVKKIFGLRKSGEGRINAKGKLLMKRGEFDYDLKIAGNFYIQTLMELLAVKEKVEGLIDVDGVISGSLKDIKGKGTAILRNGNLYNVDVERLATAVSYENGLLRFTGGKGNLYNGQAVVEASLVLPVVNHFTLDVGFSNVDSKPLFKLIGWDPGIQPGKVEGTLRSEGAEFNPAGTFHYRSLTAGSDVLGRVREARGGYQMANSVIRLDGIVTDTGRTRIRAHGTADIKARALAISGDMTTDDIKDLTSPYYVNVGGKGGFHGTIKGSFDNPVISGDIKIENPSYEGYSTSELVAHVDYRRELLEIGSLTAHGNGDSYSVSGSIIYRDAKELFQLSNPEYRLNAAMKNADLGGFVRLFYADFQGKGKLGLSVKISGSVAHPVIVGSGSADEASLYRVPVDSSVFDWIYQDGKFLFKDMTAKRGRSFLNLSGSIDNEGRFSYKAKSERVRLSDLLLRELRGDAIFSLQSEGSGTFEDPSISFTASMIEGTLKGKAVGKGTIYGSIKEKKISVRANMIGDQVRISANGTLEKDMPWSGRVDVDVGRYDPFLSAFLKDVPEDLILSLGAHVSLRGNREHISASAEIDKMMISMYGYGFTNEKAISLTLNDRSLNFDDIVMRSGNASMKISGSMEIGRKYDVTMEGNSSLAPFKSLSSRIALLKGDAHFVISVAGDWERPQINGGISLENGSFGLKDYSPRIGSLAGYMYMDNDRIVLQNLSGKLGGGDIALNGIIYLSRFSMKRFYLESRLSNISASLSTDFMINFGGNLLYKGTPEAQIVSGDIIINRAKYKERVEWKSWLLKAKKVEQLKAEITGFEKAELNVKISGKDNIQIDNNVARASVTADMLLRGNVYRPILFGRLETKDGTVYFRNNEFRIIHASADFADPKKISPLVDISAETVVKGYKIKMNLEGQLDHFNMSLSSDPPLKEMDILSMLTVGQKGGEIKGLEGGIGAGEATSFVTGRLQDVLEERLTSIIGLDRFQIDPYVSKTTGSVEPRVTVSKRLMGEHLFVTYASTVASTEEQIIKLEYFLSRNVSLVGVRDERGVVGGDVKFRFEFK